LREDAAGLHAEFYVSKTDRGDQVLELVRDGALDQLSIGFLSLKDNRLASGVVERIKAHLAEVSLVTFGAYGEMATVSALREESTTPNRDAVAILLKEIQK
jgi:HK97 family phage prohead protease